MRDRTAEDAAHGRVSREEEDTGGGDPQPLEQRLDELLQENARLSEETEGDKC